MKGLAVAAALSIAIAFLASGCMWGVVIDTDTGAGVPGATVSYTDAEGHTASTTTNPLGLYAFDVARGGAPPAIGPASFTVSAPGYAPLMETRLIQYDDNPSATLDDLSSFWEVQYFDLVPGVPGGSVDIVDYTPFDDTLEPGDMVSVTIAYEASGPFEFEVTLGYEVKATTGTWWCDDERPVSAGSGTLILECSLGSMPAGGPPEFPYPHDQGVVEALLTYRASATRYDMVAGEYIVDDRVCPSFEALPWPDCPPATPVPPSPSPTRTPAPPPTATPTVGLY